MYKANVEVTVRRSILDPQGKATQHALHDLGFSSIEKVRVGKHIELWIEAADEEQAMSVARAACEKLLANPIMEDFQISLEREPAATQ